MNVNFENLDSKIAVFIQLIYWEDSEVINIVKTLDNEDKEIVLVSLYNRYEAMMENRNKLLHNLETINWVLESSVDKIQAEEINFNF